MSDGVSYKGWEMQSADEALVEYIGTEDPDGALHAKTTKEISWLLMRHIWTRYPLFGPAADLIGEVIDRLNNRGAPNDLRDPSPAELERVLHQARSGPDAKPWDEVPPEAQRWYRGLVETVVRKFLEGRRVRGVKVVSPLTRIAAEIPL